MDQWFGRRNPQDPSQTPGAQGLPDSTAAPLVWPDEWIEDPKTTAQRHADFLAAYIARSRGLPVQSASAPPEPSVAQAGDSRPGAQPFGPGGSPSSGPDLWSSAYDQAQGKAPLPWERNPFPPPASANAAPPLPDFGIGRHGYRPAQGDENLLARMIFAEGSNTPEDFPALAWATVNRIGAREFGGALRQVVDQKNGFQSQPNGGGAEGGSPQWRITAEPSKLTGSNLLSWRQAQQTAHDILAGSAADPTGGAQFFFASTDLDGDARKAAGALKSQWFSKAFKEGRLEPSQYQGRIGHDADGLHRNYFATEPPERGAAGP